MQQASSTPTAPFAKRAVAIVIDFPAMLILSYLIAFLASFLMAPFYGRDSAFAQFMRSLLGVTTGVLMLLFQFFYFGFFWSRSGRSIGMKLTGIQVVRRNGDKVGFFRSGLRGSVGYWISGLIFMLGFIWAAFDKNGEAWHDKLFDTKVIPWVEDPYAHYANYPGLSK